MTDLRSKIIELLKSYPQKKRQIEQLRFELEHPSLIGEKELIDSLSIGINAQRDVSRISGHISNKTMTIALQYQDIMQRINNETITDIMQELRSLESEITRLEYYISLLDERKATAIRLLYFEQMTWNDTEREMNISKRSLLNYRKEALNDLVKMYSYLDGVKAKGLDSGTEIRRE